MSVGSNAKQAILFLRTFYEDVQSLMVACEQILAEQKWAPPPTSKIAELSNSLNHSHRWVLDSAFRSFIKTERDGGCEAIVLLVLLNVKHFDDARVLGVRAHFAKSVTHEQIWNGWLNAERVLDYLTIAPPTMEIPKAEFEESTLPDASRARGILVPIDSLSDENAARSLLIGPLLKHFDSANLVPQHVV